MTRNYEQYAQRERDMEQDEDGPARADYVTAESEFERYDRERGSIKRENGWERATCRNDGERRGWDAEQQRIEMQAEIRAKALVADKVIHYEDDGDVLFASA